MNHRHFFTVFRRVLFGIATILFLLFGAVLTRLYIEPVDLAFLTPKLVQFLEADLGKTHLRLTEPHLRWRGLGHSLEISAKNLEVKTLEKTGLSLQIPTFYLTFRFRSLVLGHFLPSTLTLEEPQIIYHPEEDSPEIPHDPEITSKEDFLHVLTDSFVANNHTKILKRIRIINASLSLDLGKDLGVWQIPKTTFVLNRKQGFIDGLWDIQLDEGQKITASFAYLPGESLWKFNLHLESFSLPFFARKLSQQEAFNKPLLKEISDSRFPLTGDLKGTLSDAFHFKKVDINLTSEKGIFDLPSVFPQKQPFQGAILEGGFDEGNWFLSDFSCATRGAELHVSGGLKKNKKNDVPDDETTGESTPEVFPYSLSLKATLENFLLENLEGYWPQEAVIPARSWLVQHLKKGSVPKATLAMKGAMNEDFKSFSLKSLGGDIHLTKTTLKYLDTMPKVTNLSAQAHYNPSHFSIHVTEGESAGLKINKGHVLITGLDQDFQDIDIKTTTTGPLKGALQIIDSPPLAVLKETAIKVDECQGSTTTDLHLTFPLDDRFADKGIQFSATTDLAKASIPKPLAFLPIDLSNADIALKVTNDQLDARGTADLNHLPATVSWARSLNPNKPSETVRIKTLATPLFIKSLGVDVDPYLKGILPADVVYTRTSSKESALRVALNLAPAYLTFGDWEKALKIPGTLTSKWSFQGGDLARLDDLTVRSHDLSIKASADFQKSLSSPRQVTVTAFQLGKTDLKGTLSQGKDVDYKIFVEGNALDLSLYLEAFKTKDSTDFQLSKSFDLRARIPTMTLLKDRRFFNNSLSLRFLNGRVHSVAYKGFLNPDATKDFYIDVLPRTNNGRRLRLKCQDAGYMLQALNFFDDVAGGSLKLTASQFDDAPDAPWQGKLEIKTFWLGKAPIISRLLSLAFSTGLVDAFSEKGLPFDRLKIKFKKSGSHISLYRGRSYSPGFGFSVNGSIKQDFSQLNVHGTVYPAYFFNTLFSRIPLLGQLLMGGKHEGIWGVSYTITGPSTNPEIRVNPLTAFAPGIFRKIFLPSDDADFEEEEESDDDNDDYDSDDEDEGKASFIE